MEQSKNKTNLTLAIIVAIALGLASCLLWGILYYFGYFAWVVAFLIVFAVSWGYKKFNLKIDKKGYFIISLICLIEVVLTMFITIALAVNIAYVQEGYYVSFFECFLIMFDFIKTNAEFRSALLTDSILTLLFMVIGLVVFFIYDKKKEKSEARTILVKEQTDQTETVKIENVSTESKNNKENVVNDDKEENKKEDK